MPHRIPTRRIPKMRKHRMNTTLRHRRIHIKLHPPILPRNIPLVMHHHTPQRSRIPASHQMPCQKIITPIHQRSRPNHRQNHPLQNHRRSHFSSTPSRRPSLTPSLSSRFPRLQHAFTGRRTTPKTPRSRPRRDCSSVPPASRRLFWRRDHHRHPERASRATINFQ